MKRCFDEAGVRTAHWIEGSGNTKASILKWADEAEYPIISKSLGGSRGRGNIKHDNKESLEKFLGNNNVSNYIFERFHNFDREYRLHVSKNGCFYTCRKVLKREFKDHPNAWQRHDDNCSWLVEENPGFDKPINWDRIVADCVKALKALKLDIAGFDVKVQGSKDSKGNVRKDIDYIIIESNSACSFGEVTEKKYREELNRLIAEKCL